MRLSPFLAPMCAALLLAACAPEPAADTAATTPEPATQPAEPAPAAEPAAATIDESILEEAPAAGADNRIPAPFHGTWDESADSCRDASEARLVVSADTLRFHESSGTVERVQLPADNEIVLRLAMRGEGEQWQTTERFALSADGSELYDRGQSPAFVRVRCGG